MPAINKPNQHFNAVLYSGANPSSQTVGVGFQPDFVWIKSRTQTYGHYVFDVVRTPTYGLITNTTAGDSTGDALTFTANGFTTTAAAGATNDPTGAPNNFACFSWKAGGAAVTNTVGTISAQVSANPTAGFSVVTYTSTTGTVGHGLGVAPSMIIMKPRNNTDQWTVGHVSLNGGSSPWNYGIPLNTTATTQTNSAFWNDTAPTSTVFSQGSWNNSYQKVAYCWAPIAGYSSFGAYTGNGSTDGPFVYTGFRPRWIMIRSTSNLRQTLIYDTASSNPFNTASDGPLATDTGDVTSYDSDAYKFFDILSNGFKLRRLTTNLNATGESHIYAAFAESPFKYANAR
jgi:hypothetical protein